MIVKNSSSPMYRQLYDVLLDEIKNDVYDIGGNIGTQIEISKRFNVSLITTKKALKLLSDEGFIEIKQGKGTFIKDTFILDNLDRLTGTSNILKEHKIDAEIGVIKYEICKTPYNFSNEIISKLGENCIHIERIHKVKNKVVAFAHLYIPLKYKEYFSKEAILNNTIYGIYQNDIGIELGYGVQHMQAGYTSAYIADALEIDYNTPVMKIERESYDVDQNLIEYMLLQYEHSSYSVTVRLELKA